MARKAWSYSTGEKGRNRVRVFCKGCEHTCTRASDHPRGLYVEWYEGSKRFRELLRAAENGPVVRDTGTAKARADTLAAEFASIAASRAPRCGSPLTLQQLLDHYNRGVTATKGSSKQHDRRARLIWLAFFNAQAEPSRRPSRPPVTLDRTDWDRFAHWRGSGRIAGQEPVRGRQVEYDLKYMLAVLNWGRRESVDHAEPVGRRDSENPIRDDASKQPSPHRPAMTDALRERLIEHQPSWQMGLALTIGRHTRRRNNAVRQLLWSDLDFDTQMIRWRSETDKAGRANVTFMPEEIIEPLRMVPSTGHR